MDCDLTCSTLHGYFDNEMSAASDAEFKRHLEHCSDCVAELDACYFVRDSLQRSHIYEHAPALLRRKIRADLRSFAPTTASSQARSRRKVVRPQLPAGESGSRTPG